MMSEQSNAGSERKYQWFIVCATVSSDAQGKTSYSDPQIIKGISEWNAVKKFIRRDDWLTRIEDYGGPYSPVYGHTAIARYATKAEAEAAISEWEKVVEAYEAAERERLRNSMWELTRGEG